MSLHTQEWSNNVLHNEMSSTVILNQNTKFELTTILITVDGHGRLINNLKSTKFKKTRTGINIHCWACWQPFGKLGDWQNAIYNMSRYQYKHRLQNCIWDTAYTQKRSNRQEKTTNINRNQQQKQKSWANFFCLCRKESPTTPIMFHHRRIKRIDCLVASIQYLTVGMIPSYGIA